VSKPSTPALLKSAGCIAAALVVAAASMIAFGTGAHGKIAKAATKPAPNTATTSSINDQQRRRVRAAMSALPLAFEANQGQNDPQVKYMARGNGYTLFLTQTDAVFAVHSRSGNGPEAGKFALAKTQPVPAEEKSAAIHMQMLGANSHARLAGGNELPGRANYYIGKDSTKWQQGVRGYSTVTYSEVYPGVNVAFHGQQRQAEFDFIVAPGASAAPIDLGFKGASKITTDDAGNLVLSSDAGNVVLHKPVAYQQKNGQRQMVDVSFETRAANQIAFTLGAYDQSRELVIDPSVTYATYLGGTAEDDGYGIGIDGSGNAYITGQTASTNFPTAAAAHGSNAGGFDVFVTKISADGSTLVYSTYVGGSGNDSGNAIAVNSAGNAFVTGGTASSDFPVTGSADQQTYGGGSLDAFVLELATSGSMTFSTYVGGSGTDVATGIAVDGSGNTYIAGSTTSTNFPVVNSIQGTIAGASNGFVTKLHSAGTSLVYSTYLGGGTGDLASAIALDSSNNAYVTGATENSSFPTTSGVFQSSCGTAANCNGSIYDAFVSVIKADGSGFVYSTFLGGSGADQGIGIAVDSSGDAYITGSTQSSDFPTQSAVQSTYGGVQDAFVSALNPQGTALLYSTYLGGSQTDGGAGIAIDSNKNAYITGQTGSSNFPTASATQATLGGGNDAFVTELNPSGSLVFSTYLGGSQNEDSTANGASLSQIGGVSVDNAGANVYVTGNTDSTDFPTASPEQSANAGNTDAFIAKYTVGPGFYITNGALSPASGSSGATASAPVTVYSVMSFSSTVNLTCSVSPSVTNGPTCSFTNASVTPSASGAASTLNIATTGSSAAMKAPAHHGFGIFYATLLPIAGITLLGAGIGSRRRKMFGLFMLVMVMATLIAMPACGGSSNNGGGGGGGNTGTPAGSYTITVTGTSGSTSTTGTPALTFTVN